MVEGVRELIRQSWHRGIDFFYVFPSEMAASLWAKDTARNGGLGSVGVQRFVSWDSFKERFFRGTEERRPANTLVRTLFVQALLNEFAKNSSTATSGFRSLVPPGTTGESTGFVNTLVPRLPTLGLLWGPRFENQLPQVLKTGDPDLWADYKLLLDRYRSFLATHNYYEPGWMDKDPASTSGQGYVFFPELLEDWLEFEPGVRQLPGVRPIFWGDLETGAGASPSLPNLQIFPNTAEEVGALFDWVEGQLDQGIRPGEIILSLGGYDDLLPLVEREARRRSIPLEGRKGRALTDFRGPGFFVLLSEAQSLTFESLEALFLSPALPLLPEIRTQGRRLLRRGIEKNAAFGTKDGWEWALFGTDLLEFFHTLADILGTLSKAKNFSALRITIEQTLGFFVGNSAPWHPEDLGALQRARELVKTLEETQAILGLPTPNPFGLWVSQMQSAQYVPQGQLGVVEVYPYRVGAGIPAPVHGILNLSQEDSGVVTGGFSFLRDDQLELLGAGYRIMTEDFLQAYGESGSSLWLSTSLVAPSGPRIPATYFQSVGTLVPKTWTSPPWDYSHYRWAAGGVEYSGSIRGPGSRSNPQVWTPDQLTPRLTGEHQNRGGYVYISARQVKQASSCLLEYIVSHGLKVQDRRWKPEIDSPMVEGNVYHQVLEALLGPTSDPAEFLARMKSEVERICRKHYPPVPAKYVAPRIVVNLGVLGQKIWEALPAYRTWGQEQEWARALNRPFPLGNLQGAISGRIDWLAEVPGSQETGLAIVDFKRTVGPSHKPKAIAKAVRTGLFSESQEDEVEEDGESDSGPGVELQLLLYSLLVSPDSSLGLGEVLVPAGTSLDGAKIGNLAYVQLAEKGKLKAGSDLVDWKDRLFPVYSQVPRDEKGSTLAGPSDLLLAQTQVLAGVDRLLKAVEKGIFPPSPEGCLNCPWRGICRTKFVLTMEGARNG